MSTIKDVVLSANTPECRIAVVGMPKWVWKAAIAVGAVVVVASTLPVVLNHETPVLRLPAVIDQQDHTHPGSESARAAVPKDCMRATRPMTNATGEDYCIWDSAGGAWRVVHP